MSTARQRQLRFGIWRGLAIALLIFTGFAVALDYVDDEPHTSAERTEQQ